MCRLSDWRQKGINTETLDWACCCLRKLSEKCHLEQDVVEYERELGLKVCQRTEDHEFIVGRHNHEFFDAPPALFFLFYVHAPVFWNKINCLRVLRVLSAL